MKYLDDNGDLIFVRSGIGEGAYKAFRRKKNPKSGNYREKGLRTVEYKKTVEEAEADLAEYAKKKGWKPIDGTE